MKMSHSNDNVESVSTPGRRFFAPTRMRHWDGKELPQRPDKKEVLQTLQGDLIIGMVNKSTPACIFRVPKELFQLKESAYTPRLFPIGPLHIDMEHLKSRAMVDSKMANVYNLLWRTGAELPDALKRNHHVHQVALPECFEEMEKLEDQAKACYAEYVEEELTADRMLVDGCFILELLFKYYVHKYPEEHDDGESAFSVDEEDPYIDNMLTRATVQSDLLMLGNQLPFFVLEKLFELTVDKFQKKSPKRSLTDYVLLYLGKKLSPEPDENTNTTRATNCCLPSVEKCVLSIFNDTKEEGGPGNKKGKGEPGKTKEEGGPGDTKEKKYYHILHVIHDYYLRFNPSKETGSRLLIMPCASELDYAGVKFVAGTGEDLFKVKFGKKQRHCRWFHRAQFEIPQLTIDYTTEPFLRNLIAFEQCSPKVSSYFTSYAFLMGLLVNSEKDVQVLAKAGIIHNYLGTNQDAADLLNNLCQEVVVGNFISLENAGKPSSTASFVGLRILHT